MSAVSSDDLAALVATHLARCLICQSEPLFASIGTGDVDSVTATMGRAVLIAHMHPKDPDPQRASKTLADIKKAVAFEVAAADSSDLVSDIWAITRMDGTELGRVWGDCYDTALYFAKQNRAVRDRARQGYPYRLRRLRTSELRSLPTPAA